MSDQITVTVTYTREGVTLLRVVGLAEHNLAYEPVAPIVLSADEYGSETWNGFTLTNHTGRSEKRATA